MPPARGRLYSTRVSDLRVGVPRPLSSEAPRALEPEAARALGLGGAVALGVYVVPFTRFVFHALITLVHELGHAIVAWAFAIPAIPSFDFVYGGGVTITQGRSTGLLALFYVGFAVVAWRLRGSRGALLAFGVAVVAYTLAALTPLHEAIEVAAGHGSELLFAGIFLYRAFDGTSCRVPSERPAYAFCAIFILLGDAAFAIGLLTSASRAADYEEAKGGGHWMDFSRLADDYLHLDLQAVVFLFLLATVLVPFASYLAYRNRAARDSS